MKNFKNEYTSLYKATSDKLKIVWTLAYAWRKLFFLCIERKRGDIRELPIKNSRFNISQEGEKKRVVENTKEKYEDTLEDFLYTLMERLKTMRESFDSAIPYGILIFNNRKEEKLSEIRFATHAYWTCKEREL